MVEKPMLPIILGIFLTGIVSWLGWMTIHVIETDRTQDVVLNKIEHIEDTAILLSKVVNAMPTLIDDEDRWYRSDEIRHQYSVGIYNTMIEFRIVRLEKFHPPESNDR